MNDMFCYQCEQTAEGCGQCNDAYGVIRFAFALVDEFGCGVNELPLRFFPAGTSRKQWRCR